MDWYRNPHSLKSNRIQQILSNVYLFAKYGNVAAKVELEFEPYRLVPHTIEQIILYRPHSNLIISEALRVSYSQIGLLSTGMFYLSSGHYGIREEAASSIGVDAVITTKILDAAQRIWRNRASDEG